MAPRYNFGGAGGYIDPTSSLRETLGRIKGDISSEQEKALLAKERVKDRAEKKRQFDLTNERQNRLLAIQEAQNQRAEDKLAKENRSDEALGRFSSELGNLSSDVVTPEQAEKIRLRYEENPNINVQSLVDKAEGKFNKDTLGRRDFIEGIALPGEDINPTKLIEMKLKKAGSLEDQYKVDQKLKGDNAKAAATINAAILKSQPKADYETYYNKDGQIGSVDVNNPLSVADANTKGFRPLDFWKTGRKNGKSGSVSGSGFKGFEGFGNKQYGNLTESDLTSNAQATLNKGYNEDDWFTTSSGALIGKADYLKNLNNIASSFKMDSKEASDFLTSTLKEGTSGSGGTFWDAVESKYGNQYVLSGSTKGKPKKMSVAIKNVWEDPDRWRMIRFTNGKNVLVDMTDKGQAELFFKENPEEKPKGSSTEKVVNRIKKQNDKNNNFISGVPKELFNFAPNRKVAENKSNGYDLKSDLFKRDVSEDEYNSNKILYDRIYNRDYINR